eukprot:GHVQ01017783.1.p1 GENE.GHVQ01017783.1~~GHVQ01017783.1.p1  ORF type:complete len:268 (+),score=22.85 GHVQ01017783.1:89-892(+)
MCCVCVHLCVFRRDQLRGVMKEIELQSHLCHPHIVPLLTWFHDEYRIGMVLDYCNQGSLFSYRPTVDVDEHTTSRMLFDIVWALRYCHAHRIAHLDLKPENIMVHNGRLLLADFGLGEHMSAEGRIDVKCKGTHDYWAPEQTVRNDRFGPLNHKADIWAIGVLAYEIMYDQPPFGSTLDMVKPADLIKSIGRDPWDKKLHLHTKKGQISKEMRNFINQCLQKVSCDRPTAEELLEDEFIRMHNEDKFSDTNFSGQEYKGGCGFNTHK